MTDAQNSQTENPTIYYAIILLATGLVIYKWFNEVDKSLLINTVIQLGIAILIVLWFFAIIFFYVRGVMLEKKNSYIIAKILIHITNFSIIVLFIYRFIRPHLVSIFFIVHGLIALFLFMYYNYIIPKNMVRLKSECDVEECNSRAERDEIFGFIYTKLDNLSIEELKHKREHFRNRKYSEKALKPFKEEFNAQLQELDYRVEKAIRESEIYQINREKNDAKRELESIREEKRKELMDEESEKAEIVYNLTEDGETVIVKKGLSAIEKEAIKSEGYKQVNEYCAYDQKILTVFVKPIMNHSPTHTFLVWSVNKLLENLNVTNIEIHDTKDADITFKYNSKLYAIEIETGTALKKKERLNEKVAYLNRKYHNRWFFIVSNRNLQAQYKKYGLTTRRNRVLETLQKMLEIVHPKKVGVKAKASTKELLK